MNNRIVGFVAAFATLFGSVFTTCVSARNDETDLDTLFTATEDQRIEMYEIKEDGIDTSLKPEILSDDNDGTHTILHTAAEAVPFFSYSNEYYASKYGENGHGYAYSDIIEKNRTYQTQRKELYDGLLDRCRAFTTNYADVPIYVIPLGGGNISPDMYRIGDDNIEIGFSGTGLDMDTEADRLKAAHIAYEVYFTFKYDHPEYYWLSNTLLVFWSHSNNSISIVPQTFTEFVAGKTRQAIDERVQRSLDWYLDAVYKSGYYDATNADKTNSYYVCAVLRKMITEATEYGYQEDGITPLNTGTAHSIVSVLDADLSTSAVCEGYAQTFQLILNALGIDNIYVTGEAGDDNENHAWNMVKMPDNLYYYFDITWEDRDPYHYFAIGSGHLASEGGGHRLNVSSTEGVKFLYDLPFVIYDDYNGGNISNIVYPTPQPDSPLETFEPGSGQTEDLADAEEVMLSTLMRKKYDSVWSAKYGDLAGWEISITDADGKTAQYGTDFVAYYDGKLLDEVHKEYSYITSIIGTADGRIIAGYYNNQEITADDLRNDLKIYAKNGVTVTVTPLYLSSDWEPGDTSYYNVNALQRSYTVGEPERSYISISLRENVVYKPETAWFSNVVDFSGVAINIYEDANSTEAISPKDNYGKLYKFEYQGTELIYSDYVNCLRSTRISSVFDELTLEDVIDGGVLKVQPGCRVEIRSLYTQKDKNTGDILLDDKGNVALYYLDSFDKANSQSLKKDFVVTLEQVEADEPLKVDLTIDYSSAAVAAVASKELPEGCRMYIASYNSGGEMTDVWSTEDSVFTLQFTGTDDIVKAFIFDNSQKPACDMQYIRLRE